MKKVTLSEIEWPVFGDAEPLPPPTAEELRGRIENCRTMMERQRLTHLIVYGDREHFANICYLSHFDPRFEEALMIVDADRNRMPLLVVGNECVGHLNISPLFQSGELRYERYQPFSLLGQPRNDSRSLADIFLSEGIGTGSAVGCTGWKYFSDEEFSNPRSRLDIPSFIADVLREICPHAVNATDLFMSPSYGLRSVCSVYEIALFEHANVMASEGMINLLKHFRAGITDFEMVKYYGFTGYPLSCHVGIKSSGNQHYGLSSPVGAVIERGAPCSTNIAYWGSNICRAGWVAEDEHDLPDHAKGYVEEFAAPYFRACALWLENLRIGTPGAALQRIIDRELPFEKFGVFLNPGHLIHLDEWVSSPVYKGSREVLRSGMCLQIDIIPRSREFFSSRMEDGVVLADDRLQEEIKDRYPDVYRRCQARRAFITDTIGIDLPQEVLPLSNMTAIVPPYFLNYRKILTLKK